MNLSTQYSSDVAFTPAVKDIPQRFEAAEVAAVLEEKDQQIALLEEEVARLRGAPSSG